MKLLHWPAMLLTGVGPLGIIFLSYDFRTIRRSLATALRGSVGEKRSGNLADFEAITKLGTRVYTEGAQAIEEVLKTPVSADLQRTLKRLASRMPVTDILQLHKKEFEAKSWRLEQVQEVFNLGGRMAPSVGMLGTILGMVQLLGSLEDPSKIGSSMSVALLTTFFGLFFSLVAWTPLQQKIQNLNSLENSSSEQIIHWLELLEERKPMAYFSESSGKTGHL
jgi:chemotaxis protein MotA